MQPRIAATLRQALALVVVGAVFNLSQAFAAPTEQDGVQVVTRGPVHEAFAGVVAFDHQSGVVVPKSPPDAIDETPPEQRPAGTNVAWIPGYWAWDDEADDFLWVSGVWRFLPPGRQWIAGYWGQSDAGYQWTSGYWADANENEIEYLPQPPATTNIDPIGQPASEGQTWIPGVPIWNQNAYTVRPGYWAGMQTDWQWTPATYVQTPRGYVFVDGYWDYSLNNRGVLYAPARFNSGVMSQPGFSYAPSYAINPAALIANLFLRPTYGHYYFGDYYAGNYGGMGYYPSYAYHNQRGYDPFYAQQLWMNRQDANWQQQNEAQFLNRQNNEAARPPQTLAAQNELVKSGPPKDKTLVVAAPTAKLTGMDAKPLRFQPVTEAERKQLGQNATAIDKHRGDRRQAEVGGGIASGTATAKKAEFTPSPIVAKSPDQLGAKLAPPKVHDTPKAGRDPASQADPKPAAKPAPKAEPKRAANPEPKAGTKPTPRIRRRPATRSPRRRGLPKRNPNALRTQHRPQERRQLPRPAPIPRRKPTRNQRLSPRQMRNPSVQ
ncbi:MAG: hypothetical protein NT069_15260 [Planctomycetota bacterium]|nr:hypothetical protein [Planctomycetota bacterium]